MQPIEKILSKRQQSELVTAIKGRGEIPVKFSYIAEGAKHWDEIAKKRVVASSSVSNLETKLLDSRSKYIVETFEKAKKINLVDLGCGNGDPVYRIMQEMQKLKIPFRYVPIDISRAMLDLASERNKRRIKGLEVVPIMLDFESGSFPDQIYDISEGGYSNLMLLLGNTLGNMPNIGGLLTNIRDSMSSDDFLVIGMQLINYSKVDLMLAHYTSEEMGDLLYYIPELIGINRKQCGWNAFWNERMGRVEIRMKLLEDVKVHIGKEHFTLEKGESILLDRSAKFTESRFVSELWNVGFRTELLTASPDEFYAISMVQPTRYAGE